MARDMFPDSRPLYRAVILGPSGNVTAAHGPYEDRRQATGMVTRRLTTWRVRAGYTGHVETTAVDWQAAERP